MKKIYVWLLPLMSICLSACKKNDSGSPPPATLQINAIDPASGGAGTLVTIRGTGFSAVGADDTVSFNGKAAAVTSATTVQLTATVPPGAGTGAIRVSVGGNTVGGPTFNYVPAAQVSTLAGSGTAGHIDGRGGSTEFFWPAGVAVDGQGNIYIADAANNCIRKITPAAAGAVSTLAGSGDVGFADGAGTVAQFNLPLGVAVDVQGNVYVADAGNNRIRKITPAGDVSTLAGNGVPGHVDGPGTTAEFNGPENLVVDAQGNIYVTDTAENKIREVSPTGVVGTLAGDSLPGYVDGAAATARFNSPLGLALDGRGNLYIVDAVNSCIRKLSFNGIVSTVAGDPGIAGFQDGTGTAAAFKGPNGITADALGNVYVTDLYNERIRMISPAGVVTTIAGNGTPGFADGPGAAAEFYWPWGIAADSQGNLYVGDWLNNRIRKISFQ